MPSLLLLLEFLLLTPLIASLRLPIVFPKPSNSIPHLSLPLPLRLNASTGHCTTSDYWRLPTLNLLDCQDALNGMYISEVFRYGTDNFEFVSPGVDPHHSITVMKTPRRYASGLSPLYTSP